MAFRLHTFGGLRLEQGAQPVTGPPAQRRRLALLALLAAHGERGISREKAFGYLWPEHDSARARHQLSEAAYVLRKAIGPDSITAPHDDLRLEPDVLWSDVGQFKAALARSDWRAAVDLYRGPFLDGFFVDDAPEFDQWVAAERSALARDQGRALEAIAQQQADAGELVEAADWWRRASEHDPFSSRVAIRFMEALAAAGDRARAIQFASQHTSQLRSELAIEPDAEFAHALQSLQRVTRAATPARADDPLAELAGEFEIVRVLGEGSVAKVYLAREIALKRSVAIKVMGADLAAIDTARRRFEREAQAAARIQHPNVVTAFRFGRLGSGLPYMVLPYISGGSLEDRLAAAGAVPLEEGLRYLAQLAGALAAAHKLGLVHRDVRPANILYDRETSRMLLTDFGIAAVLDDGSPEALRLTRPGEQLGNIAYASPEQLRGEPVTERSDVYSLGITAFEMLTGQHPFAGRKGADLMVAHVSAEPPRLRDLVSGSDPKTEALLQRCMNKRPEQRPYAEELC